GALPVQLWLEPEPFVEAASAIAVKADTSPESSIGTTTFDEGEAPTCFSASRYWSRIVLSSTVLATSKIFCSALEKPSARRIADCRSPSAVRIADCFEPSALRIA